jgi:hypothetical protein
MHAATPKSPAILPHLAASAVLLAATLCCFHKLARHPDEVLVGPQKRGHNDLIDYFLPSREFAAKSVRDGEWPFWNASLCLGVPVTGNPQSALDYPPNWLTLAIPPQYSLSWLLVAHHLFAGLGVYFLARRHRCSWGSGVLGGVVFLAAPYLVAQSAEGHFPQICAVAWAPWAFLAYESLRSAVRRPSNECGEAAPLGSAARSALALSFCLAMSFFCGHAQETYYLVLLLTGCMLWDAVSALWSANRRAVFALPLRWCQVGLFTAGLVAVDLLPIFLHTRHTLRPSARQMQQEFGRFALTTSSLRELLNPFASMRPELSANNIVPFWEGLCHFGVVPLALAVVGVVLGCRRPISRRMTVLWVLTLLFAFGSQTPIYNGLAAAVPGMTWFRLPCRALFFTSFATAVLAAAAADVIYRGMGARFRRFGGVLVAGLVVACSAELTRFADQVTATARLVPLAERDPELLAALNTGPANGLQHRVFGMQAVLSDRDALAHDILKTQGYEPAGPAKYLLLSARMPREGSKPLDPMGFLPAGIAGMNQPLLDLLAVKHAMQVRKPDDPPAVIEGWRYVRSGSIVDAVRLRGSNKRIAYTYDLLQNEDALPRAFVVGQAREISSLREFTDVLPEMNFRQQVALARDVLPEGNRATFAAANIVSENPRSVEIETELDAPGYLVLSDLSFPGWHVAVAGQELPVLEANGFFRAVPLPPGKHRVQLTFQPQGLVIGALITLLTIIGITLLSLRRSAPSARESTMTDRDDSIAPPERPSAVRRRESVRPGRELTAAQSLRIADDVPVAPVEPPGRTWAFATAAMTCLFLIAALLAWLLESPNYATLLEIEFDTNRLTLIDRAALLTAIGGKTLLAGVPLVVIVALLHRMRWRRSSGVLLLTGLSGLLCWLVLDLYLLKLTGNHAHDYFAFVLRPRTWQWAGQDSGILQKIMLLLGATTVAIGCMLLPVLLLCTRLHRSLGPRGMRNTGLGLSAVYLGSLCACVPLFRMTSPAGGSVVQAVVRQLPWPPVSTDLWAQSDHHERSWDELSGRLSTAYASAYESLRAPQPLDDSIVIPAARRPNIVVFVLESLRHTALAEDTMPRLCRRAEQGLRCRQHYAGSNLSHYGLFSLLYGRSPLVFDQTLDARIPPQLCHTLKQNGYTTSFITSGACDDWQRMGEFLNNRTFDRVVTHDDASWVDRDRKTLELVRRTLTDAPADQPQFVVAFLMSTHFNYEFPPEFAVHQPYAEDLSLLSLRNRTAVLNRYRNAAAFLDHAVDETIAGLDLEQTLVAVTGDHGESLMDDGMMFHGSKLSEIQTRVPFFLCGAGIEPGGAPSPTTHADLLPTIVGLLTGRQTRIAGCHGQSMIGQAPDRVPEHVLLMHGVFNLANARMCDRAVFVDKELRFSLQLWRNEPNVRVTAFVNDRDQMLPAPDVSVERLNDLVEAFSDEMTRYATVTPTAAASAVASGQSTSPAGSSLAGPEG